jgi:phage baseplate assembly protein W
MALSPLQSPEDREVAADAVTEQPTKTYVLDFDSGDVTSSFIDGTEAVKQAVQKSILSARSRFLIYDDEYGCELDELIGEEISAELLEAEINRVITEALLVDDRITDVTDIIAVRTGDQLYITISVSTVYGEVETEVTV